ncbi:putative signal transducing protein [Sphingobacterium suaedae]|uniref:Signal transducing protein n=1 Tax=Sphingobacterium suaedae TaxID=1686402 RepID=A0ABW5KFA8_9SPHI
MITLKTFDNPVDAHLLKTRLECEGISSCVFHEPGQALNPLLPLSPHSYRLDVGADDLARAQEVLLELDHHIPAYASFEDVVCPHCRSEKIDRLGSRQKGTRALLLSLFSLSTMSLPMVFENRYYCNTCNRAFEA